MKLIILFLMVSCVNKVSLESIQGKTMGTTYHIKYVAEKNIKNSIEIKTEIDKRLLEINQSMSTYIEDSELNKLNNGPINKWIGISRDLYFVLSKAYEVYQMSEGYYDVTVGPLVNLWGFGPKGLKKSPSVKELEELKEFIGLNKIELDPHGPRVKKYHSKTKIDLSSLAKGFGVDEVGSVLEKLGIHDYFVEIGGEVKSKGKKGKEFFKVAIEAPEFFNSKIEKVLPLFNKAMATSGSYRNYFLENKKIYSHTIDPKTLRPIENQMVLATVIDPNISCMTADALATAFMALGPEKGMQMANKYHLAVFFLYGRFDDQLLKFVGLKSFQSKDFVALSVVE